MKSFGLSLAVGFIVGLLYYLVRVRSPAPPFVALTGLLGMVMGEAAIPWIRDHVLPLFTSR